MVVQLLYCLMYAQSIFHLHHLHEFLIFLPAVILYTFPTQVFNVIVVSVLAIYSIMFALNLLKIIVSKKNTNNRFMLKKYMVIFMFCIILSFISSLLEVYFFPNVLKLFISIYS